MEKFSTEYFRKLASDLKFSLTDEEIEALKKDFEAVEAQVHLFEQVDTEGVEPMIWPFETPTVFLREDVENDGVNPASFSFVTIVASYTGT